MARVLAFITIGLFSVSAWSACPWKTVEDLLISTPDETILSMDAELSPQDLSEDLDCLKLIFTTAYAQTSVFKKKGIDLTQRLEALQAGLNTPVNSKELLNKLLKLHQGTVDVHSGYGLSVQGEKSFYQRLSSHGVYTVNRVADYECEGFTLKPSLDSLGNKGMVLVSVTEKHFSTGVNAKCHLKNGGSTLELPVEEVKVEDHALGGKFKFNESDQSLYAYIPNFWNPSGTIVGEEADFLNQLVQLDKDLIIDLRNKSGGNPLLAFEILRRLILEGESLPQVQITQHLGPMGLAALSNEILFQAASANRAGDTDLEKELLTDRKKWMGYAKVMESKGLTLQSPVSNSQPFPDDQIKQGLRKTKFEKRIVVLTDRTCGSACDVIPAYRPYFKNMTIIGVNTSGATNSGTPGRYLLPHSKVMFRGAAVSVEGAMVPQEGVGVEPDFYVLKGDALSAALHYLSHSK